MLSRKIHRLRAVVISVTVALASSEHAYASDLPSCQASDINGPVRITPNCVDPVLRVPYVDEDKAGVTTDPTTGLKVDYRYIHGGFRGTKTKFALYFPEKAAYAGWFIESTYPSVTTEDAGPSTIAFAISHGAYVVSTNNNGGLPAGGALAGYRANAAASRFSRVEAERIYGSIPRPRGFIFGASGGAYQTIGAAENTEGIWDGSVPMVPGVPNAIPSFQSIQLLGLRGLGDALPQIVDAMAPGGSGDPYAGLTESQAQTLHEVSSIGFPLRGWWQYATLDGGAFRAVSAGVEALDPNYVDDFWSKPNYEGADPAVAALRIRKKTRVVGVAGKTGLVLESVPDGDLLNADLTILDGPKKGTKLTITGKSGATVQLATTNGTLSNGKTGLTNTGIVSGTRVEIDNSWLIALQYYPRHQVPSADQYGWRQYLNHDGMPSDAQRPKLIGPLLAASSSGGAVATGRFHGKMIMLASTMDVQAFPWSADWYKRQVSAADGSHLNERYRLWYMDNADHDPDGPNATNAPEASDHIVSYQGEYEQALLYLNDWVAHGEVPPPSSGYKIADAQVRVDDDATARHGVQPLVALNVQGMAKAQVKVGEAVLLSGRAQMPPKAGCIVKVEWDQLGNGNFIPQSFNGAPSTDQLMSASVTYAAAGTYFPTVKVFSERRCMSGRKLENSPYALVQNIARVRVIVGPGALDRSGP